MEEKADCIIVVASMYVVNVGIRYSWSSPELCITNRKADYVMFLLVRSRCFIVNWIRHGFTYIYSLFGNFFHNFIQTFYMQTFYMQFPISFSGLISHNYSLNIFLRNYYLIIDFHKYIFLLSFCIFFKCFKCFIVHSFLLKK